MEATNEAVPNASPEGNRTAIVSVLHEIIQWVAGRKPTVTTQIECEDLEVKIHVWTFDGPNGAVHAVIRERRRARQRWRRIFDRWETREGPLEEVLRQIERRLSDAGMRK